MSLFHDATRMAAPSTIPAERDLRVTNDTDADTQIREGYAINVAVRLQEVLDLSDEMMAEILGRSRRTYRRYRNSEERLGLSESERLFRYLRLLSRAEEVFGSREKAAWWLSEPNAALDGREPVEVALTAPGAGVVEDLLGGLEHGFPL
jgi:putative toxin-antitoxin system antitoxin component (TIGR02293 family)